MKKLVILTAALSLFAVPAAFAGTTSGCGWGSQLFKGDTGAASNILATSFNGTSSNNAFGITFGTSGCDPSDAVMNEVEEEEFVAINFENISTDMAKGQGQYVNALASLMGCSAGAQGEFAKVSQEKYGVLFSAPNMDSKAWLAGLKTELAKDSRVAGQCTRIS